MTNRDTTYRALDVAKWFILQAAENEAELSNLKLQKLLYYAQGHSLAVTGKPLFDAPIEAWDHGPVVVDVYRAFKSFGAQNIPVSVVRNFNQEYIDSEARRLLESVWSEEGSKAAWVLREKTHGEAPWRSVYVEGVQNIIIERKSIQQFFVDQHMAPNLSLDDAFAEWADESLMLAEAFLPAVDRDW